MAGRFTTENARLMSAKGLAVRRLNRDKPPLEPVKSTEDYRPADDSGFLRTQIGQVEAKIKATLAAYDEAETPRDMQYLALALDKLWRTWALLTGHETPGIRKSKTRRDSAPSLAVIPREASQ